MNPLLKEFNFVCETCFDTGIWLSPVNTVEFCPKKTDVLHFKANPASLILSRAVHNLAGRQFWINPMFFDTARILTNFTSENPCSRQLIVDYFFAQTELSEANRLRRFHKLIESLREYWLLPIGSRKTEPGGYWVISEVEDCKAWLRHATAAPKTQLATLWHVARHNFPVLAGQTEFDFMNSLEEEETE